MRDEYFKACQVCKSCTRFIVLYEIISLVGKNVVAQHFYLAEQWQQTDYDDGT